MQRLKISLECLKLHSSNMIIAFVGLLQNIPCFLLGCCARCFFKYIFLNDLRDRKQYNLIFFPRLHQRIFLLLSLSIECFSISHFNITILHQIPQILQFEKNHCLDGPVSEIPPVQLWKLQLNRTGGRHF